MLWHYRYAKIDTGKQKRHGKRAPGMRTVLERPKSQVSPHGEAHAGAPRAPHGATAARSAPRNTQDIRNDANSITKKRINMAAKVMH